MKNDKLKILILTGSIGNPRSFPLTDATSLDKTYPYLIRDQFPDAIYWQLSFGNITTNELLSQAVGYLHDWNPDIIIIQSGINDCRPEAISSFQKELIKKFSHRFFSIIRKIIYNPKFIKWRNLYRVSPKRFKIALIRFRQIFISSRIIFIEINAHDNYEIARPNVLKRINEFNEIIKNIFPEGIIRVKDQLVRQNGYNSDNLHLDAKGHSIVAKLVIKKYLNEVNGYSNYCVH